MGAIAAQSIGEPTTQQTLNTFHLAGVAAKSQVLSGLPRIKELLRVTKNIQTGLQEIFLDEEHITDKYKVKNIANSVEYTTLKSFTKNISVYFDPNPKQTVISEIRSL